MKKLLYILPLLAILFTGCIDDDDQTDYVEWKRQNDMYVAKMESASINGVKEYEKIVPIWAPADYVLIKWHNDRTITDRNLSPLSNSTVDIKYELEDIDGNKIENSYSNTQYGDSIYRSMPNENIKGMWIAMTAMHVGDSCTLIIPYFSGYGAQSLDEIKPFSTLIYHVKMKGIPKYEKQ